MAVWPWHKVLDGKFLILDLEPAACALGLISTPDWVPL